jgi:tripartite-type tricarboxylate transporter receptor subunit TctC
VQNHSWVFFGESTHDLWEDSRGNRLGASNSHFASCWIGQKFDVSDALLQLIKRDQAAPEQRLAIYVWLDTPPIPIKKWHAQCMFEVRNYLRYSRLGNTKLRSRLAHAAAMRNGEKCMQVPQPKTPAQLGFPVDSLQHMPEVMTSEGNRELLLSQDRVGFNHDFEDRRAMLKEHIMCTRRALLTCLAAGLGNIGIALAPAHAGWPERQVTVIVPFAAGGVTDTMARLAADWFTRKLGQPFIVENRAGAAGAIAAQFVATASPDGYTLLFGTTGQTSIVPYTQRVRYDALRDLAPIGIFGQTFSILGISASVPATDLRTFIEYAKATPGKVNFASGGVGSFGHLVGALFAARAGLDIIHVPYKGGAPALSDLLAGQVQMYFGNSSDFLPYKESDKIRILAVNTPNRVAQLPNVPTISEIYPGFSLPTWNGLLAPARTPKAILAMLAKETHDAAQDPTIASRLRDLGIEPGTAVADELGEIIRGEQTIFRHAVKAAGLTKE